LGFSLSGLHWFFVGKPSAKQPPNTMKSFMILGAVIGFLIGAGFSLAGDCPWSIALWRAPVGALAAALLARWWWGIWHEGLRKAIEQQQYEASSSPPVNAKPAAKL